MKTNCVVNCIYNIVFCNIITFSKQSANQAKLVDVWWKLKQEKRCVIIKRSTATLGKLQHIFHTSINACVLYFFYAREMRVFLDRTSIVCVLSIIYLCFISLFFLVHSEKSGFPTQLHEQTKRSTFFLCCNYRRF